MTGGSRKLSVRGWAGLSAWIEIVSLFILLLLSAPARAQSPDPDRMMRRLEKSIAKEKTIRLETAALQFQMERPRLSDRTLSGPGDTPRISLDEIREISVYRNYSGRGAGIGALLGIGAAALFAAWADALSHEESGQCPDNSCHTDKVALMAVGAGVGALLGVAIAVPFNGWKVIYREPAR